MMVRFCAATCGVVMFVFLLFAVTTKFENISTDLFAAEPVMGSNGNDDMLNPPVTTTDICSDLRLNFISRRSGIAPLAVVALELAKRNAAPIVNTVIGTASRYNSYRPGYRSGGPETASGEPYDPTAWAAAIQSDLRGMFGGVRYGNRYRPTYALVNSGDKQVIIKINDVGPLKSGRVIDFNEMTMRYFDPTLKRGVIPAVKVTPLPVDDCTPGPIESNA